MKKTVASMFGHSSNLGLLNTPSDSFVLPECLVGIEIEAENIGLNHPDFNRNTGMFRDNSMNIYWKIVKDGSLRSGLEFVTPTIYGKDISEALFKFGTWASGNTEIKMSYRCSTHIHLDVRDMDKDRIINLLFLYILFEELLFKFWDDSRQNNNYCMPVSKCYSSFLGIGSVIKSENENEIRNAFSTFSENNRYAAFNFAALVKYGSVEFRHGAGTLDMAKIALWINVIMCMKKTALAYETEELINTITEKMFMDIVLEVFGDKAHYIIKDYNVIDLKKSMYKTKSLIKSIALNSMRLPDYPEMRVSPTSGYYIYNTPFKEFSKAKPKHKKVEKDYVNVGALEMEERDRAAQAEEFRERAERIRRTNLQFNPAAEVPIPHPLDEYLADHDDDYDANQEDME